MKYIPPYTNFKLFVIRSFGRLRYFWERNGVLIAISVILVCIIFLVAYSVYSTAIIRKQSERIAELQEQSSAQVADIKELLEFSQSRKEERDRAIDKQTRHIECLLTALEVDDPESHRAECERRFDTQNSVQGSNNQQQSTQDTSNGQSNGNNTQSQTSQNNQEQNTGSNNGNNNRQNNGNGNNQNSNGETPPILDNLFPFLPLQTQDYDRITVWHIN